MGTMNKKKIKKLWKRLNKERTLLTIIAFLLTIYLLRMIVVCIYMNNRNFGYVDFEGKSGNSKNCGLIFQQEPYCRVDGKWHPVQTYWEE